MQADFEQSSLDVTKLSNYPYVCQSIQNKYDFQDREIEQGYLKNLDSELRAFVGGQKITKQLVNRRQGIIKHLRKILTNKFTSAKLTSFGSFESGLSLATGDIDLCLEFTGEVPKKVLKKIARMLDEDGMKDIKIISNARVPIVKFIDTQSMISIDISVNNNLSVYNTELIRRYNNLDNRVKSFILAIKYWALNRGICNPTSGTFSSYAWTLIGINALQDLPKPVLPNLIKLDGSDIVKIGNQRFDVSMLELDNAPRMTDNKDSVAQLLQSFFYNMAANWPWNNSVISVRSGKRIPRKTKGWSHKSPQIVELINDNRIERLGKHSLPVEDPFDTRHDLSVILDAGGVLEIRDEILRANLLIHEGENWSTICEPKYPESVINSPQLDLFHDLRSRPLEDIKFELKQLFDELAIIEKNISVRESERNNAIQMSKALRRNAELAREQSSLASELRPRRKEINELKSKRDSSNNHYVPVHFINDELSRVYTELTESNSSGFELSFAKEKTIFSWFFELQSMHEHSKTTREYHREFLRLVNEQEQSIDQIKNIRGESMANGNFGTSIDFDELAKKLLGELNPLKKQRRVVRREIGRLEAWLRRVDGNSGGHHTKRKRYTSGKKNQTNFKAVKNKVASGDSFSLQDLDLLLKHGGLKSVEKSGNTGNQNNRKTKKQKTSVKPHRGKRGKYSKNT